MVVMTVYIQAVHGPISERFKVDGQRQVDGLLGSIFTERSLSLSNVQFSLLLDSLFYTRTPNLKKSGRVH